MQHSSAVPTKEHLAAPWSSLSFCCRLRAATPSQVLRDAAAAYKVDTDALAAKVKQEFAAKEKAKEAKKSASKPSVRTNKKAAA